MAQQGRPATAPGSSGQRPGAMAASSSGQMMMSAEAPLDDSADSGQRNRLTVHEANRVKKAVETNAKAIESRIKFFQREEEKIWRDLEEVRRQASTIEEGRSRTLEKKLADRTIAESREAALKQNQVKAQGMKQVNIEQRKRTQFAQEREKAVAGQEQRRISQDILRQKRMNEAQARLQNSERAVAIQRAQLEARLKMNQEKSEKIERMRDMQEASRLAAEMEVQEAECRLPALEAEEMVCLQRLQNSRIVTQSVLEELESSLGTRSSVTSLLRSKQKQQEHLDGVHETEFGGPEDVRSPESHHPTGQQPESHHPAGYHSQPPAGPQR